MELLLEGAPIFLADQGKGFDQARRSALFVHGAGMDHSVWPLQARHFAYRGWNALAVDLPGHGRSGGELLESIEAMAHWLARLVEALPAERTALVGHSMGALVCLELAARRPELVSSLALLGAAAAMPVHPALLEAAGEQDLLAPEMICDWGFGPTGHVGGHRAPGSWMLGHALRLLRQAAGRRLHTDLAACADYRGGAEAAAKVRCPALVIAAELDRMTPAKQGAKLAAQINGTQLVMLRGCGHMMMVEEPDATLDALAAFFAKA
jgi:pimeloyl-ACP methyl ester carboxylesterase